MTRLDDLMRFYQLLTRLEAAMGGTRLLSNCDGRMNWPKYGVYYFFEPGEMRSDSGEGPRVVRVGTHAVSSGSKTTLWNRLSTHRGSTHPGGGNHRGSIFRLLLGSAIIERDQLQDIESWGIGSSAKVAGERLGIGGQQVQVHEQSLELAVSKHIRNMPFLWLAVEDEPGRGSSRAYIERSSIALLSNFRRKSLDAHSEYWLGRYSDRVLVRESGLWNQNHVAEQHDTDFLSAFKFYVEKNAGQGNIAQRL